MVAVLVAGIVKKSLQRKLCKEKRIETKGNYGVYSSNNVFGSRMSAVRIRSPRPLKIAFYTILNKNGFLILGVFCVKGYFFYLFAPVLRIIPTTELGYACSQTALTMHHALLSIRT